jgi:uncharacterized protein (DUF2141 family)
MYFTSRSKNSVQTNLTRIAKACISIILALTFTFSLLPSRVFAAVPNIETTLRIIADGASPFDATTYSVGSTTTGGTDATDANGVVRVLDYMTYRFEVSLNNKDDTNVVAQVYLDADQQWSSLPGSCLTDPTIVNPISSISDLDTTAPGNDKRLLICNLGQTREGTKYAINATAQVKGTATNAIAADQTNCNALVQPAAPDTNPSFPTLDNTTGCVSAYITAKSDNSNLAQGKPTNAITTANFKVDLEKSLPTRAGHPEEYKPVGSIQSSPVGTNGNVMEYNIVGRAMPGSEGVANTAGKANFTLRDCYVDNNPNDGNNTSDLACNLPGWINSSHAKLYNWDPSLPAAANDGCVALSSEVTDANLNCSQPGGPGTEIVIQANNVDVTYPNVPGQLFKFKVRLWIPVIQDINSSDTGAPYSNAYCTTVANCTIQTINQANFVKFNPNPANPATEVIGEPTSVTGLANYNGVGESQLNNAVTFPLNTTPPGSYTFRKSFDSVVSAGGTVNYGGKKVVTGEIIPVSLYQGFSGSYPTKMASLKRINCEKIDTSNFEFDSFPSTNVRTAYPSIVDSQYVKWGLYNPLLLPTATTSFPTDSTDPNWVIGTGSYIVNAYASANAILPNIRYEFAFDPTFITTPAAMRADDCLDDLDGNPATTDWFSDPNLVPGGKTKINKFRIVMDKVDIKSLSESYFNKSDLTSFNIAATIYLKVKGTNPYTISYGSGSADMLPDYTWSSVYDYQSLGYATVLPPTNTEVVTDPGFSLTQGNTNADRVELVPAKYTINKKVLNKYVYEAGEIVEYEITPRVDGSYIGPINFTLTDTLPNSNFKVIPGSFVEDTSVAANGTYVFPTSPITTPFTVNINGAVATQPLRKFRVKVQINDATPAGDYTNTITMDSNIQSLDDASYLCTLSSTPIVIGTPPACNLIPPNSKVSLKILNQNLYEVYKEVPKTVYEINQPISYKVTYLRAGSENYSNGDFIDILPFNGDNTDGTTTNFTPDRENTLGYTPGTSASTFTEITTDGFPGLLAAPVGANAETFRYTKAIPSTIPTDVCHSANQPAGFVPTNTNGVGGAYHPCYAGYVINGNKYADGATTGTGTIVWCTSAQFGTAGCPANFGEVTAFRIATTPHTSTQATTRSISFNINPKGNKETNIYCNSFSGRVPEISLNIISNDVCARVVSGNISGTVWRDQPSANGTLEATDLRLTPVTVELLTSTGASIDSDPNTAGVQPTITTTNSLGFYEFKDLNSGSYQTRINWAATPAYAQTYDLDNGILAASYTTANNSGTFTIAPISIANPDPVDSIVNPTVLSDVADKPLVDYAYAAVGTIGDTVFYDVNGNAIQDANDPGIAGVPITATWYGADGILGNADDVTSVTTTDALGKYTFTNLPFGNYKVVASPPAGYSQTYDNTIATLDNTSTALITNAVRTDNTNDFGYTGLGTLGDYVWWDVNGDGLQTTNEPPLAGVGVTLTWAGPDNIIGTADDINMGTQTTGTGGNYLFTKLPPGKYLVDVNQSQVTNGNLTTANDLMTVVLAPSQNYLLADFGFNDGGTVGNQVWFDTNKNGIYEPLLGETGIKNVEVSLYYDVNGNGTYESATDTLLSTQLTNSLGQYTFTNLLVNDNNSINDGTTANSAKYLVAVTDSLSKLSGYTHTYPSPLAPQTNNNSQNDGRAATAQNAVSPAYPMTLSAATTSNVTGDFGYYLLGSVGDTVWMDLNANGIKDATELGIGGVPITVVSAGLDGIFGTADDVTKTTTTSSVAATLGQYLVTDLPPGPVKVTVTTPPAGYTQTYDNDGGFDNTSTTQLTTTTLPTTMNDLNQDFGYKPLGTIGDYVWNDINNNGTPDLNEPGFNAVPVQAIWAGPDGNILTTADNVTYTTTTNSSGYYQFQNLPYGSYQVTVTTPPSGYLQTYDQDDAAKPATGASIVGTTITPAVAQTFTTPNRTTLTISSTVPSNQNGDFGYTGNGSIGDTVYFDSNNNNTKQTTEPGIAGVTVTLTWAGPDGLLSTGADNTTQTTTTNTNGLYQFSLLPMGTFQVSVAGSPIATYTQTQDPDATKDNKTTTVLTTAAPSIQTDDFGYYATGTIGDTIFIDSNNNGVYNPLTGETGISGVEVTLYSDVNNNGTYEAGTDTIYQTQSTNSLGQYQFINLPLLNSTTSAPMKYLVAVTDNLNKLSGMKHTIGTVNTNDNSQNDGRAADSANPTAFPAYPITLSLTTTSNQTADFGYLPAGKWGDTVYFDTNGNATQETNEQGIPNVNVTLKEAGIDGLFGTADDVTIGTQVTDAFGAYLFTNLAPGKYQADVLQSDVTNGNLTTANDPHTHTLLLNETYLLADFGFNDGGTIGNQLFFDANNDGIYNTANGDQPIAGVTVDLYADINGNGIIDAAELTANKIATQTTNALGQYQFTNLLVNDNIAANDGTTPNSAAYLVKVTDTANKLSYLTHTTGAVNTNNNSQTDGMGTNAPYKATLSSSTTSVQTADFGYTGNGTIGNNVFLDANNNGIKDSGELGIKGVTVTLVFAGFDNNPTTVADNITYTTTTDVNGNYTFTNLPTFSSSSTTPSSFTVTMSDPTASATITDANSTVYPSPLSTLIQTFDENDGALPAIVSPTNGILTQAVFASPLSTTVTLSTESTSHLTANVGMTQLGTVGDLVFKDYNANGIQETALSDIGIKDVTIAIFIDINHNGILDPSEKTTPLATTTTDVTGAYLFTNLPLFGSDGKPQTYLVAVTDTNTKLSLYSHTTGAVDTNNNSQTDGMGTNPAYIASPTIQTPAIITADFGYQPPPNLFDPPSGTKVVDPDTNQTYLSYKQVWINDSNTTATVARIVDTTPANTTYKPNSLVCSAQGVSSTTKCLYDETTKMWTWEGTVGADAGKATEATAANEIVITYTLQIPTTTDMVSNQSCMYNDQNGDGYLNDLDTNIKDKKCQLSDDPSTPSKQDPTIWNRKKTLASTGAKIAPYIIATIIIATIATITRKRVRG